MSHAPWKGFETFMIYNILIAVSVMAGVGLLFGLVLGIAGKIFHVAQDERIDRIIDILPCVNCGGCGFSGCNAYAHAVVDGKASPAACSVGGSECAQNVAQIMDTEAIFVSKVAAVKCGGCSDKATQRYDYTGYQSCDAVRRSGTAKACTFGCLGTGSCAAVCDYGAIKMVNGIAEIDSAKCTACGKCIKRCPQKIIEFIPQDKQYYVACHSQDRGKEMKDLCTVGCIACGICVKNCPTDAITIHQNSAVIDHALCTGCSICAEKCPKKTICSL